MIINNSRVKHIDCPYSEFQGGRAISHNVQMEYHDTTKFKWTINTAFFDNGNNFTYEPYYTYEEAKDLIAKDRAFRGTISFKDGMHILGLIKSDDFVKRVYAKGYNINRALNNSEVIFCPVGLDWEKYLIINQTKNIKNIEEIEHDELMSEQ